MIQQTHKFPFRHFKSRICISGNSFIFSQFTDTDTGILFHVFFQDTFHNRILRTAVCNTKLPVGISLCQKRFHHLYQKCLRSTKSRNCHTDQRFISKTMFSLFFQFRFIRNIGFIPWPVGNLFRFKSFMKTDPEFFRSIMPEITKSFLYCIWV